MLFESSTLAPPNFNQPSPDGTWLAYGDDDRPDGHYRYVAYQFATGKVETILDEPDLIDLRGLGWADDSSAYYYIRYTQGLDDHREGAVLRWDKSSGNSNLIISKAIYGEEN